LSVFSFILFVTFVYFGAFKSYLALVLLSLQFAYEHGARKFI